MKYPTFENLIVGIKSFSKHYNKLLFNCVPTFRVYNNWSLKVSLTLAQGVWPIVKTSCLESCPGFCQDQSH